MSIVKDYDRIVGSVWGDVSLGDIHRTLTLRIGLQYATEYWGRHVGNSLPWDSVRETGGNRNSWVRQRVLVINVGRGWEELNHTFSHFVGSWLGYKPHGDRHLELERDGAEMICKTFLPITARQWTPSRTNRTRSRQETIEDWAQRIGCDLDDEHYREHGEIYIYPPGEILDVEDPFRGDHVAYGRRDARRLLAEYERLLNT